MGSGKLVAALAMKLDDRRLEEFKDMARSEEVVIVAGVTPPSQYPCKSNAPLSTKSTQVPIFFWITLK